MWSNGTVMNRRSLLSVLLCGISAAFADPQGKGKGKGRQDKSSPPSGGSVAFSFGPADSRLILDYYHPAGSSGLPPGLAKRGGDLPPGLEKQLRRNGTLPPGLQKKLSPFPRELDVRLAPPPSGCRRVTLGTRALLVQDATNVVLDIIDLTVRR